MKFELSWEGDISGIWGTFVVKLCFSAASLAKLLLDPKCDGGKTSAHALDAVVSCAIILLLQKKIVLFSVLFLQNMLVLLPLLNIIFLLTKLSHLGGEKIAFKVE